jgi:hypothetical protein
MRGNCFDDSLERYPTQNNDDLGLEDIQLAFEEGLAIIQFLGGRFVSGRSTTTGGGNVQIVEDQPIASRGRVGLVRKSRAEEGGIEESARAVARKLTPCAVGAMCAGGESHHEEAGVRIAKSRDGFAPVFLILVGFAFCTRHFLAPFHEARTFTAGDDFFVERGERIHVAYCVLRNALENEHRIAKGVEAIAFLDGGLICFKNFLAACKRADKHDERGLW